jgi:cysteine synthase A
VFCSICHTNVEEKNPGMGAGLLPLNLDLEMLDEVVPVHSDQAMAMANELWMIGVPVGVSAGAIVEAACQVCATPESAGKMASLYHPLLGEAILSLTRCFPKSSKRLRD